MDMWGNRISSELNLGDRYMKIHDALLFLQFSINILLILGSTLAISSPDDLEHVVEPLYASVSLLSLASSVSYSLQDYNAAQSMARESRV